MSAGVFAWLRAAGLVRSLPGLARLPELPGLAAPPGRGACLLGVSFRGGLLSLALCLAVTNSGAAAEPQTDYGFCTVCHGTQGNGNAAIHAPKIAGIEPWYLKRQLQHFRAQVRGTQDTDIPGMEMQPVAMQLDDQAIQAIMAYVGAFEPRRPPVTVTGDVRQGQKLYQACAACHGARGEGNSAVGAPALAGQTDWYLVTQLERFQGGLRGFSPQDEQGLQMRAAASALPDKNAVNDVVAYINTLAPHRRKT